MEHVWSRRIILKLLNWFAVSVFKNQCFHCFWSLKWIQSLSKQHNAFILVHAIWRFVFGLVKVREVYILQWVCVSPIAILVDFSKSSNILVVKLMDSWIILLAGYRTLMHPLSPTSTRMLFVWCVELIVWLDSTNYHHHCLRNHVQVRSSVFPTQILVLISYWTKY